MIRWAQSRLSMVRLVCTHTRTGLPKDERLPLRVRIDSECTVYTTLCFE